MVVAYLGLSGSGREVGLGGSLFEAGRLLTFSAFRMGAYSRWALIRGCALIRINTVVSEASQTELRTPLYDFPTRISGFPNPLPFLNNFAVEITLYF